ncbi:MAG: 5'-nucleotidase C-terminal domain-containing protein [Bacteroidales bacterium]|jgi:2',3'-cyclic-nucleotide 2'-phosphodiesterase/3'-nucleotidase|nr:5'-nucleotidase C-terminal domain-containing protein [Bacteroidales bacterium]
MRYRILLTLLLLVFLTSCNNRKVEDGIYEFSIFSTNDIHGKIFPFDYIDSLPLKFSLSSAVTVINERRKILGKNNIILIDNGDHLQGDNSVFYYNYIDTSSNHLFSDIVSWLGYDAVVVGNHDIEAGHSVYDRLFSQEGVPYVAANIINLKRGLPYFEPYKIINKGGIKIAIIGMTNPNIKKWLSEDLWSGMEFEEILPSLQRWVDLIKRKEKPDIIIAALHAGLGETEVYEIENPSRYVALNTNGIDMVFAAHDHKTTSEMIYKGTDSVLLMAGGGRASAISRADVKVEFKNNVIINKKIEGTVISLEGIEPDSGFLNDFKDQFNSIKRFTTAKIGKLLNSIKSKEAYTGPSSYIDMIHSMQLSNSGADISFAAPLSYNVIIEPKELNFQDMFNIYPFENQLYVINLTGFEIKNYLEFSYSKWINKFPSESGHLLKINTNGYGERSKFLNPYFNFDSAAGILYEVDIRKGDGERIDIISMSDESPFDLNKTYTVALSSYRANGGGDLLQRGCNLTKIEMEQRIVKKMGDIRELLYNQIKRDGFIEATPLNHWKFIPEKTASKSFANDMKLL